MIIAMIVQEGGCDYTIGCGVKVVELKARTPEEARQEVAEWWKVEGVVRVQLVEGEILADWEAGNEQGN